MRCRDFPKKEAVIVTLLFIIALIPRILLLGTIYTIDEPLWISRSSNFINAISQMNLSSTFQTEHPGVTTMWVSGLSMRLLDNINILFAAKFPVALLTSLTIPLIYYFVKKIFNRDIAILSALLVALDPFYIANSRLIHMDALLTSFVVLSILSFIVFLNNSERKFLILSGLFAGLSFLTKTPGFLLVIFIFSVIYAESEDCIRNRKNKLRFFFIWCLTAISTFVLLWPAMWVNPIKIVYSLLGNVVIVMEQAHWGSFFMGKVFKHPEEPGLLFYPVVLLIRSTPVTFIFSLISLFFLTKTSRLKLKSRKNIFLLVSFILIFTIIMSIALKKGDRYMLPVFPIMNILAATGLYYSMKRIVSNRRYFLTILSIIVLFHAYSSLSLHPYYLSYYSPLLGGPSHAPDIIDIGGGEGLEKAAEYLNQKENAEDITVVSLCPDCLKMFFRGNVTEALAARCLFSFYEIPTDQEQQKRLLGHLQIRGYNRLSKLMENAEYFLDDNDLITVIKNGTKIATLEIKNYACYLNREDKSDIEIGLVVDNGNNSLNICTPTFYENPDVDYLLFYISQVQRKIPPKIVDEYIKNKKPEYTVEINDITYVWIYKKENEIYDDV